MTEKIDNEVVDSDLKIIYPIHYHGYIHMYDPNAAIESNKSISNDLIKRYGENADELGIG